MKMAKARCKICGRIVSNLTAGICSACKTVQIYEDKDAKLSSQLDEEYNPFDSEKIMADYNQVITRIAELSKNSDEYGSKVKNPIVAEKEDFLKYLDLSDAEKADFIFNKICKKYNFDSNFIKRYRPQLKRLSSQYGGAILDGYYAVTLSSVEDERQLIVKDIIGPLIVYIPDPIERKGVFVKKVDLGKLLSKENSVITDALTDVDSKIEEIEEYPDDFEENGV